MAGWIKMPLGTEVGLDPGNIVLDGDPAPPWKGTQQPPTFVVYRRRHLCVHINHGPCLLWPNGWMDEDTTWYGGRPWLRRLCLMGTQLPPEKRSHPPLTQFLAHVYCGQTAGWMKMQLGTEVDLRAGHIVLDGFPTLHEGAQHSLFLAHVYCGHGRPSQLLLSSC